MKKIVAIGGGTGLSNLLRGLKDYPLEITAIVTMTDDGSSTGRLRKDLNILPPGDIRKCIAALSPDETKLIDLFEYRFNKGLGLSGHSLGNLLITALKEMTGSFETAVEEMSQLLSVNGKVLPASFESADLEAIFDDGRRIVGESKITKYGYGRKIKSIILTKRIKANPKAIQAINEADLILIGPGSFYTSIIPNYLIPELKLKHNSSKAPKIFICNVSTERGETEGFAVEDHLSEFEKYKIAVDKVLINSKEFPRGSGDGFVIPVPVKNAKDGRYVFADLVDENNYLYHSSDKLSRIINNLVSSREVSV